MNGTKIFDLNQALSLRNSKSQLGQDVFALYFSDFKLSGTFLEIGAADGVTLSNTYILEKYFNWTGILCEPAFGWRDALKNNRSAELIFDAIWSVSGEILEFREVVQKEYSTISKLSGNDQHAQLRNHGNDYLVKSLSLPDLIQQCRIPSDLDYLSIDTEGSEFDILKNVDFGIFQPRVITVEHNFTQNRELIFNLLTSFGYKRCFEELSRWDDWYILRK